MCRCWWLRTRHGLHRLSAIVRLTGVAAFGEGRKPGTSHHVSGFSGGGAHRCCSCLERQHLTVFVHYRKPTSDEHGMSYAWRLAGSREKDSRMVNMPENSYGLGRGGNLLSRTKPRGGQNVLRHGHDVRKEEEKPGNMVSRVSPGFP